MTLSNTMAVKAREKSLIETEKGNKKKNRSSSGDVRGNYGSSAPLGREGKEGGRGGGREFKA